MFATSTPPEAPAAIGAILSTAAIFTGVMMSRSIKALQRRRRAYRQSGRPQSLMNWDVEYVTGKGAVIRRKHDISEEYVYTHGLNLVNGVAHPPFVTQQRWDYLRANVQIRPSDVLVSTFPKCGTTWTEQMVLLLLGASLESLDPANKNNYNPKTQVGKVWVERSIETIPSEEHRGKQLMSPNDFSAIAAPRILKTHSPAFMSLAMEDGDGKDPTSAGGRALCRIIYVTRNPRDAAVSAYYHAVNPHKCGWPFDAWVRCWLSGSFEHGSWYDHVRGWYAAYQANPEHILWVHFEEMKADPEAAARKIARFIGISEDKVDAAVVRAVTGSSFTRMKAQAENNGAKVGHLRNGRVGDWKHHAESNLEKEFAAFERSESGTVPIAALWLP